jgi:hypothetical protein
LQFLKCTEKYFPCRILFQQRERHNRIFLAKGECMKRSRWIQGVAGFAGVALTLAGCSVHVENAAEISETVSPAEETSGYTPLKERVQVDSLTSNSPKPFGV